MKIVFSTLSVPQEKFSGTTDPTDHVVAFESHIDLYGATGTVNYQAFPTTFRGIADPGITHFLFNQL